MLGEGYRVDIEERRFVGKVWKVRESGFRFK